ncbi:uncharacterized protein [Periplaneta americana]|uniref:uncharacterized protein n=1 Tax=Periplaneta americana TaxID=6978 RepID=UPI0037E76238
MSENYTTGFDHQLQSSLHNIKHTLTTKIPYYLESTRQVVQLVSSDTDIASYNVLDCSVTPLKSPRNEITATYRAQLEIEENRRRADSEESRKIVTKENVIVKMMINPDVGDMQDSKHLFYAESKMFSDIIPLLLSTSAFNAVDYDRQSSSSNISKALSLFPKCYYNSRKPKDSVIVLEDIQTSGYRFGGSTSMIMDYDHIVLALQGLARYHALSYAMKRKDPQGFYRLVVHKMRKGKKFCTDKKDTEQMYAHAYFQALQFAALQPLEIFVTRNANADLKYNAGVERLNKLLEDTVGLISKCLIPKEPLSVLCHGNFNMKCMLFRYDSNKKPIEVKFTDFQNVHYASPAIDLSFFLFLNVSPELRKKHMDDFFSTYHRTLLSALCEFLDCPQEELLSDFSMKAFKEEFSNNALYGYILAAGYLVSSTRGLKINKVFEMFNNGVPSREEMDKYIMENIKLEDEDVIYRLVALITELIDAGYFS